MWSQSSISGIVKKISLQLLFLSIAGVSFSAEFAVINQTINWTMSSPSGFYFFNEPSGCPSDWTDPDDFYNGQFYFRYEILSIASTERLGIQFGIWQNQPGETYQSEIMAGIYEENTGAGAVITGNSSPTSWWYNYSGVDFSRVSDFDRLGIILWCRSPNIFIAPEANWGGNDDVWNTRDRWFPCSIKITVVAVSAGSLFSGWNNYVNPTPTTPPTPTYGINYSSATTNKAVPSTDEYSYNADMSSATSGTGVAIALAPGTDVYFRTKAQGINPASAIQHLDVPSRPSAPSISVNYGTEKTNETVPSTVECSVNSDMSGAESCSNALVDLTPGTNLYFRVKSTGSSFASTITSLNVPSRPATPSISINYSTETTSTVASTVEYSTDASMTSAALGAGSGLTVTPGTDLYFRIKSTAGSFESEVQHLDVPSRPSTPSIAFDFLTELTSTVSSTIEYSVNSTMVSPVTGQELAVPVTPGTDLYFRVKAQNSSFCSAIQHLVIPERPSTPSIIIDYFNENTSVVATTIEWSENSSFSPSILGTGSILPLTLGTDLYFRVKATSGSFKSDTQVLDVPERPAGPVFTIDYINETTVEPVDNTIEYSIASDLSDSIIGSNEIIALTAGENLYFRRNASNNSFRSNISELVVPGRNFLGYSGEDTVTSESIVMYAVLVDSVAEFSLEHIYVVNGTPQNLREENIFDIYPAAEGIVTIEIPANTFIENSFVSNEVKVYYKAPVSINPITQNKNYQVYPNPSKGIITISGGLNKTIIVELISREGKILKHIMVEDLSQEINFSEIDNGIYFLKIRDNDGVSVQKLVLLKY